MRPGAGILLLVFLSAASVPAQQLSYDSAPAPAAESFTNALPSAVEPSISTERSLDFNQAITARSDELLLRSKVRVGGPLVHLFKPRDLLDLPKRLLDLVNPFSKALPAGQAPRVERVDRVDPRAWTTIVGWTPGQTAFADDTHHEPQLRLLSFSTATKPPP